MAHIESENRSKILLLLRKYAPYSVIDLGIELAQNGAVLECNKQGSVVHGLVRDSDAIEVSHSLTLQIISGQEIEAQCDCCTPEEMHEQWCSHAVSLFWRACELGFFDSNHGFSAAESLYRVNTSSPQEISVVMRELGQLERQLAQPTVYTPQVQIILDLRGDRLGVQVLFDGAPQGQQLLEGVEPQSSRALDTILLKLLEDEGSFDEVNQYWFVNSSRSIETILGIIREYDIVNSAETNRSVQFAETLLEARLKLLWSDGALELSMVWVLGNTEIERSGELLGTGPFWTTIENTIYRLSPSAARIASIFPYGSSIRIPRSQVGPILSVLRDSLFNQDFIDVKNPDQQPASEVKLPKPLFEIERRDTQHQHFAAQSQVEIGGEIRFEYPVPPSDENIVYLPNLEAEQECLDFLRSLGFEQTNDRRKFTISGDSALDLVHSGAKLFPKGWEVSGFEAARKGVRFSNLALNVSLAASTEDLPNGAGKPNWFDCRVALTQNKANVPISVLFKRARSESERWIHLDGGTYAKVPGGSLGQLKMTLGMLDPNFKLSNTIKSKLSTVQAFGLSRLEDESFSISLDANLAALSKKLKDFVSITPKKPGKNFKGKLRPYQEEGLSWLSFLGEFELGGILADEMGLGKTVQTLALIQQYKEKFSKGKKKPLPTLIVTPTSVLMNWAYESKRFTPNLKVLVLHGPKRKASFEEIKQHDIVLTSYALLRIDRQDLEPISFSHLILDEAQNIKNPHAATTRAAKALHAERKLALSGTPTENRPLELWSIMDFLMPGYLGTSDFFKTYIEKPILEGGVNVQITKLLNAKTKPFILRRTKAEVEKDLPPKIESVIPVEMTESQAQLYNQILEEVRPKVFEAVEKKGVRGASVSILAALLRLRQVCNHPNSIDSLKELPGYDSGKFNALKDLLDEAIASNRKILLFSQFREMLSIIRNFLNERGVSHLYLDGATTNRQQLIDQFNNDSAVRVFAISLKAGGTGLNLTAADTVVIYDPWWNPAVESQAVDRAHRIGQTKTVSVYRLVTEDSVEQKIMDLKAKKSKIVEALVNENGLSTLSLSKTDLMSLFSPLPEGER